MRKVETKKVDKKGFLTFIEGENYSICNKCGEPKSIREDHECEIVSKEEELMELGWI